MSKLWHKNRPLRKQYLFTALFMACVVAFSLGATETPLKSASLMPMWSPQSQFAGY